jgi:hypothetical protein
MVFGIVTGHQNDILPMPGTLLTFVCDTRCSGLQSKEEQYEQRVLQNENYPTRERIRIICNSKLI